MILDEIAAYLEDEGIGTVGTDIFIGELPLDHDDIIAILPTPSPQPEKAIPYYRQYIDIWARYIGYQDGYNKLLSVMEALHQTEHYELDSYHVYVSYALGLIEDNDRDAERRHLLKLTIAIVYRDGITS